MSMPQFEPVEIEDGTSAEAAAHALVERAAGLGASDLFLASNESHVAISVRHLGVVRRLQAISSELGMRLINYIKAMSGMDIAERRRPADGRWVCELDNGNRIDFRINSIPTLFGEDLTLRLLDRNTSLRSIEDLGLLQHESNAILSMLSNPSGLILVTGPTGSGKTTTLYSFLAHLNDGSRKINSLEDPIEYAIDNARQSQVNLKIGVDFPELLASVLRQAPDVIMIGEVRDPKTAQIAVRAANSGHLVLATLHAPVAAAAVQSMTALDVPPHFLSTSLLGIVSQRLVRTLCEACKTTVDLADSPHSFDEVSAHLKPDEGRVLVGPGRCDACLHSGYTGRTGVFEILSVSRPMRRLIAEARPVREIFQQAIQDGMIEFRKAALLKVARGYTSIEEIFRTVPSEYLADEY